MSRQKKLEEERKVRKLYDRIPEIDCKGLCHTTCTTIAVGEIERRMVAKAGVSLPIVSVPEALQKAESNDLPDCPALTEEKKCGVYEDRPALCRLWGVAEMMPCVYGCEPTEKLSDPEAWWILGKAEGDNRLGLRELKRRHETRPELRQYAAQKRRSGIGGDIDRARAAHGPDVKLADAAQLGLTKTVYLDRSSLPT